MALVRFLSRSHNQDMCETEPVSNTLCVCASIYVLNRGFNIAIILTQRGQTNEFARAEKVCVCAHVCEKRH